jgi:hypothetical protein
MSAPFVLPRKAAPSAVPPPSSSSHIPSIPSEADDGDGENSQLMADYLEYPRAYTPPSPYPHGNIGPPRPLEPRRSRASGQTHHSRQPSSGLSAVPMSGPGAGRISTATWISSSQFPPARPAQAVTSDAYDDLDISRPSGELHNNYSYNTPAPAGAHYDDGHNHEPYNAQDEEGYIPDGFDADQQQQPPSAPATEAEHMTVEAASTTHHAPPAQFNPLPCSAEPSAWAGTPTPTPNLKTQRPEEDIPIHSHRDSSPRALQRHDRSRMLTHPGLHWAISRCMTILLHLPQDLPPIAQPHIHIHLSTLCPTVVEENQKTKKKIWTS